MNAASHAAGAILATGSLGAALVVATLPAGSRRPGGRDPGPGPTVPASIGSAGRAWRAAGAVALCLVAAAVALPLGLLVGFGLWMRPRVVRLRAARAARLGLGEDLPEVVEMLRLCVGAGHDAGAAVALVAATGTGPVAQALGVARAEAGAGSSLADSLGRSLGALGQGPRALAHQLGDHLRHGTALLPMLDQRAHELRLSRRRRAEERARRVPVRVLLPLVTCVLPAFALLTVIPLLAGSLGSLVA